MFRRRGCLLRRCSRSRGRRARCLLPSRPLPVGDFHVGIAGDRRHAAVPEAVDGYVRFGVVAAVLPGGEVAVFGDAVAHPAVVGPCVGLGGKAAVGLTEEPVFVFLVGDVDKRGEHAEREADYGAVGVAVAEIVYGGGVAVVHAVESLYHFFPYHPAYPGGGDGVRLRLVAAPAGEGFGKFAFGYLRHPGAAGVGSRRRCRVGGGMVEGGCRQDERGAYPHAEVAKFCNRR